MQSGKVSAEQQLFIISDTLQETVKQVTEMYRMKKEAGTAGLLIITEWVLEEKKIHTLKIQHYIFTACNQHTAFRTAFT